MGLLYSHRSQEVFFSSLLHLKALEVQIGCLSYIKKNKLYVNKREKNTVSKGKRQ